MVRGPDFGKQCLKALIFDSESTVSRTQVSTVPFLCFYALQFLFRAGSVQARTQFFLNMVSINIEIFIIQVVLTVNWIFFKWQPKTEILN